MVKSKNIEELKEKIEEQNRCLRDKDRRIKKIENRFKTIVWIFALIGIVILVIALSWSLIHIHNNLPDSVIGDDIGHFFFVDAFQFFGFITIIFLSYSGLGVWLIVIYLFYKED